MTTNNPQDPKSQPEVVDERIVNLDRLDPQALYRYYVDELKVVGPGMVEVGEWAGINQLVQTSNDEWALLPVDMGDEKPYLALGWELGPRLSNDPLFRRVKLPQGWSIMPENMIVSTTRAYVVDETGRHRAAIVYSGGTQGHRYARMSLI